MKTLIEGFAPIRGARSLNRQGHIYVVDDDIEFADLASTLLVLEGYQVTTFSNPLAALEHFHTPATRPALLISDAKMRPLNGLELAQRCRQEHPALRVILISGFMLEPKDERHPAVDLFLPKPFLAETYLAAVSGMLNGFTTPIMSWPAGLGPQIDTRPVVS